MYPQNIAPSSRRTYGCGLSTEKKDPLREVKRQIRIWARYMRDRVANGYPAHSWEGRAIERGGAAPDPAAITRPMPVDPIAEAMEYEISTLPSLMRHCLILRHVRQLPDKEACKGAHLSRTGFRETCGRAYWVLYDRLNRR